MSRLVSLVLLGTAMGSLVAQPPKSEDKVKPYTSKDGRYAVAFPSEPKVEKQKLMLGMDELTVHTASVEGKGFAYVVVWNDLPAQSRNAAPKAILDGAVQGASNRGEILEQSEIAFGPGKHPARKVILETKKGVRFQILIILNGLRMYQVMVAGTKDFVEGPAAQAFLKSFELAK